MRRALAGVILTLAWVGAVELLHGTRLFRFLELKTGDVQFLMRGRREPSSVFLVTVDQKSLDALAEPLLFWHPYYAGAIQAAARGGARVFGLDVFFEIPVGAWAPDHDRELAAAVMEASTTMPVVCIFVPGAYEKQKQRPVPLYLFAPAAGLTGSAHLRVDPDDFIRRQQLGEEAGGPTKAFALRIAEKYLGRENLAIPSDAEGAMVINYAGPAGTFPRASLADFLSADEATVRRWVEGKVVLLGFDTITSEDRHATPYYILEPGRRANTAGVEIHANIIDTIVSGRFLRPPGAAGSLALVVLAAGLGVAAALAWRPGPALAVLLMITALTLAAGQALFRAGIVAPVSRMLLSLGAAAVVAVIYQAESRRVFFVKAFSVFVGRRVARSLEKAERIQVGGVRRQVSVLFSDIRGFTEYCEQKEPAAVVEELNRYLSAMVAIIVRHGGEVNKFIGDGILAVFSDLDAGAAAGDHAVRAVRCGLEMTQAPGRFQTGLGIHTGEVVAGNVGSSDKLEHTVLGATVNLASRLEGLNKQFGTRLLLSEETRRRLDASITLVDLGAAEVKGMSHPVRVFTPAAVAPPAREPVCT